MVNVRWASHTSSTPNTKNRQPYCNRCLGWFTEPYILAFPTGKSSSPSLVWFFWKAQSQWA
jgi:hypothetical protein